MRHLRQRNVDDMGSAYSLSSSRTGETRERQKEVNEQQQGVVVNGSVSLPSFFSPLLSSFLCLKAAQSSVDALKYVALLAAGITRAFENFGGNAFSFVCLSSRRRRLSCTPAQFPPYTHVYYKSEIDTQGCQL